MMFNGDGMTNLTDMAQVKSENGTPVAGLDVRFDVNVDSRINLTDLAVVKGLNGGAAACP